METKSGSKSGSKTNLNESSVPLLEEKEGKADIPENIELEAKNENNDDKNKTKDSKGYHCLKCLSFSLSLIGCHSISMIR
jgi:hypothetical protein